MQKIFGLIGLLIICGCSKDPFPKYVLLDDFRVVALQSSTPEVNPGAVVTITPYVSDVKNTGPLTYTATGCVDAGVAYGAAPNCDGNPTAVSLATGTISTLNTGNTFTGDADSFTATIPAAILLGRSADSLYNGVNYLISYVATSAAGRVIQTFRRIVVSDPTKTTKNSDPVITAVLANGVALSTLPENTEVALSIQYPASSSESYTYLKSDGSTSAAQEGLITTWFISDGTMKYYRTTGAETDAYTTPASYPTTRSSFVLAVTRDGRGGLSLTKTNVH